MYNFQQVCGDFFCVFHSFYVLFFVQIDVDECKTQGHDCDPHAVCVNYAGGYKCQCKEGYKSVNEGRLCIKKGTVIFSFILYK